MNGGQIKYSIGFTVDQSGLKTLSDSLDKIVVKAKAMDTAGTLNDSMKKAAETADYLREKLKLCYNQDLGTINVTSFTKCLKESGKTVEDLKTELSGAGTLGAAAFNSLGSSILNTNVKIKTSSKLLDDMAKSFTNTIKWSISSSVINKISSTLSSAVSYIEDLDTSLNDIRMVTNKSAEDMATFAEEANKAAKALGTTTTNYTEASLIFYQQGIA
jgi:hypothetical protein